MLDKIESFFNLKTYNTSIRKEFLAGLASFLAISYIIVVNPKILATTGMPSNALVTSTILISAFGSITMGLFTRNPFVIAPGMGMNIFFRLHRSLRISSTMANCFRRNFLVRNNI